MQIMNDRGHATLLVHRNTLHGLASCRPRSRSNVLRLQRKDTSSCDRGASAMIRQRFDPEGTSWQISWATQEPRTRPQVRCQAEQQQQEEQEQTLPQRDPATTTRPLQVLFLPHLDHDLPIPRYILTRALQLACQMQNAQ